MGSTYTMFFVAPKEKKTLFNDIFCAIAAALHSFNIYHRISVWKISVVICN